MAATQADVDALDADYRNGVQEVRLSDGRSVRLKSHEDYSRLRAEMLAEIAAAAGSPPVGRIRMHTSRGLGFRGFR